VTFKAYRGSAFNHSHENQAFNQLYDLLKAEWDERDDSLYLFGNFFVAGKEFDALILKNNAIIVLDFKNFGGVLTFSENGPWKCDDVLVKGGNSRNPYQQIRNNKFALLDYVKSGHVKLYSAPNLGHIAGLVLFHQSIDFDDSQIPAQINSWFHICDLNHAIRNIDGIASTSIDLSTRELNEFVKTFDSPEYFPDGKPNTRQIQNSDAANEIDFQPLGSQKTAMLAVDKWLKDESCAVVIKGMSSTGKRTLLEQVLSKLGKSGESTLLIAPNARFAKQYTAFNLGEFTSIYQCLYSNKSEGVVKKSNGIELAKHPITLNAEQLEDKTIVIVEAHLISNSYYDMDSAIFGTGHMVNDLISTFGEKPPKVLLVGDPYQLSRGDIDLSLLSAQAFIDKDYGVTNVLLEQQIESEPKGLHDFQFELAQQMQIKQFNHLPEVNSDSVKSIVNDPSIGEAITTGRYHGVYLCALNDVAHKVNLAAKQKVLKQVNPYALAVGDLVDFHSSSPVIIPNSTDIEESSEWVHSGEISQVTEVFDHIDTIEFTLKGRDEPTTVRLGEFTCNTSTQGHVRLKYLIDFLHADKPGLTQDQILVLSIIARQNAEKYFEDLKEKVRSLKIEKSSEYKAENEKYKKLIQTHIANSQILNASKIRYAYAMTVHRAQGRKWNQVFLDASRGPSGTSITNDAYFRFLYTASMSAEESLNMLKFPTLTPLYQCSYKANSNCKIGPFTANKGFVYELPSQLEIEKFVPPIGFSSEIVQLKALSYSVSNMLQGSKWHVSEIKQHSFQELYTLKNSESDKIKVRFTYDKNINVKTVAYPDEAKHPLFVKQIKTLLESSPKFKEQRLQHGLEAIIDFFSNEGFMVISATEKSQWEMVVTMSSTEHMVEFKSWVGKDGLVTGIMPEKVSSEATLEALKGLLNE